MSMIVEFRNKYDAFTDREIVELVTHPADGKKPDDEGVAYLLYQRYDPLLHKIYYAVVSKNDDLYGDCLSDLFEYLKSGEPAWRKLINFEWRCSFGSWLRVTARNRFLEYKPQLIGKLKNVISIDGTPNDPPVQLPDNGKYEYEDRESKVMLMEAISLLKDDDQKFIMIKRLQGYNSKEIALLMQKRWAKHGIVKYNNKRQIVIPNAAYVDVRTQRAKENLEDIIRKLM